VNPPDQRSNPQRIFVPVPRTTLESLTVLAVIGATRSPRRAPTDDQRQVTNSRRRENAVEVTPGLNLALPMIGESGDFAQNS
jgi:hypothetical protein